MSKHDRERWDRKHRESAARPPGSPEPWFAEALERCSGGRAVDLAAGRGRHALELARRGWQVEAWDVSPIALACIERSARELGHPLETREVDLELDLLSGAGAFDFVVCVDYLNRPLWRRVHELLRPGGHAWIATFTSEYPGERPSPRFRVEPGELARGLPGLQTLWCPEAAGRAGLLAHRV